jgi:hypothetical protein
MNILLKIRDGENNKITQLKIYQQATLLLFRLMIFD